MFYNTKDISWAQDFKQGNSLSIAIIFHTDRSHTQCHTLSLLCVLTAAGAGFMLVGVGFLVMVPINLTNPSTWFHYHDGLFHCDL